MNNLSTTSRNFRDFQLDFCATLNILNTDTWNEIKEYHKLQLKALKFVLSAANNS